MHVTHNRVIDCSAITAAECSDACLVALGHGPDFALRADVATDTVHGSVTIAHNMPPEAHEITVEIYDQDEAPSARMVHGEIVGRKSTLKRPVNMPTARTLQTRLDTLRTS